MLWHFFWMLILTITQKALLNLLPLCSWTIYFSLLFLSSFVFCFLRQHAYKIRIVVLLANLAFCHYKVSLFIFFFAWMLFALMSIPLDVIYLSYIFFYSWIFSFSIFFFSLPPLLSSYFSVNFFCHSISFLYRSLESIYALSVLWVITWEILICNFNYQSLILFKMLKGP